MKKLLIWILALILLVSSVFAYYPGQTLRIPALYTVNDIPTVVDANITIKLPNGTINVNTSMADDGVGRFYYDYTFLSNVTGGYFMEVNFYNSTGSLQGIAGDFYEVEYNHTKQLDNITSTVNENKGMLQDIWDWVESTIFGIKEYSTIIIGKIKQYNTILFKTTLNFEPTNCEIYINEVLYNMSIDGKIATQQYYIASGGLHEWNVTCE